MNKVVTVMLALLIAAGAGSMVGRAEQETAETEVLTTCEEDEVLTREQVPGPWGCTNIEEFVADVVCENPNKWYVERSACRG